jgi:hypothetical protein
VAAVFALTLVEA